MKAKIIKFESKEYSLRYDFDAIPKLEELFGTSIEELNFKNTDAPKWIWACIGAKMTLDDVIKLINESDYTIIEIVDLVTQTVNLGVHGIETVNEKNALRAAINYLSTIFSSSPSK